MGFYIQSIIKSVFCLLQERGWKMRGKSNNDSMSPPRAMTLQCAGGRAIPAAGPAHTAANHLKPPMPYFIQDFTLIRLFLQYVRVMSCLYEGANVSLPRLQTIYNLSKRPLVKLKAIVNNILSFRTRTFYYDVNSFLVKTIVQLFVVVKCVVSVPRSRRCRRHVAGCRFARLLLLVWLTGCGGYSEGRRDNDLHIGGIFPMEGEGGWQGGQACMPAAELALIDVNARSDLLSGFKLLLHSNDSKVITVVFFFF